MSKKIAIIGATSGIGRALANELHTRGYIVGATGRRRPRLESLKQNLQYRIHTTYMDITEYDDTINQLELLQKKMGGLDAIVLNAGISHYQKCSGREEDLKVIDVNVRGFVNLAAHSFSLFEQQGHGHIIGISSVASLFGWGLSAPYNASKAFMNTYLQGYQQKANHSKANIHITNILPGFVESEMTEDKTGLFWIADTNKAARQIASAIQKKKHSAYITKRWRLAAWFAKLIPSWIWNRM